MIDINYRRSARVSILQGQLENSMFWTAAYRTIRSVPSGWKGLFVALLAFVFSIAITVQAFPAAETGHALTASASLAADNAWSQPGAPDKKDDCDISIHCHHASAVLPIAFVIGAGSNNNPAPSAIELGVFQLARIPAPPPRPV